MLSLIAGVLLLLGTIYLLACQSLSDAREHFFGSFSRVSFSRFLVMSSAFAFFVVLGCSLFFFSLFL